MREGLGALNLQSVCTFHETPLISEPLLHDIMSWLGWVKTGYS